MGFGPTNKQFDLLKNIGGVVLNAFNKRTVSPAVGLCDSTVLKLFYTYTFWLIFGGYATISYSWWNKDILTCASKYNADSQIRPDYLNICASYLYVEDANGVIDGKTYLLFYRWVHWVLLVIALVYYIPHKLSKRAENPKIKKLFEVLASPKEEKSYKEACQYYMVNSGTHNNIFIKSFLIHIVAVIINSFCFFALDFVFLGKFKDLVPSTYPFNRDIITFKDELSSRFPPFAQCEISPFNMLTSQRTERYGCHLTYMELYEKYFIVLWVWMIATGIIGILYIFYLSLFFVPTFRLLLLRFSKPLKAKKEEIEGINESLSKLTFGDFYLLYRMQSSFSPHTYYDLLRTLFNKSPSNSNSSLEKDINVPEKPAPAVRRQKPRGHLVSNLQMAATTNKHKALCIE